MRFHTVKHASKVNLNNPSFDVNENAPVARQGEVLLKHATSVNFLNDYMYITFVYEHNAPANR